MGVTEFKQWLKNLLLFTPMIASHTIFETDAWIKTFTAFIAFSGYASAIYILNGSSDLQM